jgi:hypothetical protein
LPFQDAVDLNATRVAVTELDRFGTPIAAFRVPCATRGKTSPQVRAAIGDAVSPVVTSACLGRKPIVADRLDFEKKKAELDQRGARDARLLSGFADATFHAMLSARYYDAGIALQRVNSASTSVIGTYTFADRSGLSRHQAAATSIRRRGMRLAERPNRLSRGRERRPFGSPGNSALVGARGLEPRASSASRKRSDP